MKFVLVFLFAIWTIAAQGSIENHDNKLSLNVSDGILDKLREIIDAIIKSLQKAIDSILGEAQAIVDAILEKVQAIIKTAQEALGKIVKKISDKLEEIAKQNETARKCVDAKRPEIESIIQKSEEQLDVCTNNAIEQSKNISKDIQKEVDAVHDNITALKDVINNCLETSANPLEVAGCVSKESNEIRKNTIALIKNARKVLEAGSARVTEIANEANSCVSNAINEAQEKLELILDDVQECIAAKQNENLLN